MMEMGAAALSNGELLAVLIRGGSGGRNALELARELLALCGNRLTPLFGMSAGRMCSIQGIGPCKAAQIMAALELGKRFVEEEAGTDRKPLVVPRMVYELMLPRLKALMHEECWALLLNAKNYLTGELRVCVGRLDATVMDERKILLQALEKGAKSVILVHNHPSGNPGPSSADVAMTEKLRSALHAVGLELLDHVIVCDSSFFSFSQDRMFSSGAPKPQRSTSSTGQWSEP